MIRERSALVRQAQQMFHEHLVGIYGWDQAKIARPIEVDRRPGQQREAGKFHDQITIRLGPFDIEAKGPFEDPQYPCGMVRVRFGKLSLDGPLDAKTWCDVAKFIKEHKNEESEYGCSAENGGFATGADWGR